MDQWSDHLIGIMGIPEGNVNSLKKHEWLRLASLTDRGNPRRTEHQSWHSHAQVLSWRCGDSLFLFSLSLLEKTDAGEKR